MPRVYVLPEEEYPVFRYIETEETWDWMETPPLELPQAVLDRYDACRSDFFEAEKALREAWDLSRANLKPLSAAG